MVLVVKNPPANAGNERDAGSIAFLVFFLLILFVCILRSDSIINLFLTCVFRFYLF